MKTFQAPCGLAPSVYDVDFLCFLVFRKLIKLFEQLAVTEDVLERYIQLEEEIAEAEKTSPSMVLQQKRTQIEQLARRIMEQQELVKVLEAET